MNSSSIFRSVTFPIQLLDSVEPMASDAPPSGTMPRPPSVPPGVPPPLSRATTAASHNSFRYAAATAAQQTPGIPRHSVCRPGTAGSTHSSRHGAMRPAVGRAGSAYPYGPPVPGAAVFRAASLDRPSTARASANPSTCAATTSTGPAQTDRKPPARARPRTAQAPPGPAVSDPRPTSARAPLFQPTSIGVASWREDACVHQWFKEVEDRPTRQGKLKKLLQHARQDVLWIQERRAEQMRSMRFIEVSDEFFVYHVRRWFSARVIQRYFRSWSWERKWGASLKTNNHALLKPLALSQEPFKDKMTRLNNYVRLLDESLRSLYEQHYRRFNASLQIRMAMARRLGTSEKDRSLTDKLDTKIEVIEAGLSPYRHASPMRSMSMSVLKPRPQTAAADPRTSSSRRLAFHAAIAGDTLPTVTSPWPVSTSPAGSSSHGASTPAKRPGSAARKRPGSLSPAPSVSAVSGSAGDSGYGYAAVSRINAARHPSRSQSPSPPRPPLPLPSKEIKAAASLLWGSARDIVRPKTPAGSGREKTAEKSPSPGDGPPAGSGSGSGGRRKSVHQ